jgi:hypothetical protein
MEGGAPTLHSPFPCALRSHPPLLTLPPHSHHAARRPPLFHVPSPPHSHKRSSACVRACLAVGGVDVGKRRNAGAAWRGGGGGGSGVPVVARQHQPGGDRRDQPHLRRRLHHPGPPPARLPRVRPVSATRECGGVDMGARGRAMAHSEGIGGGGGGWRVFKRLSASICPALSHARAPASYIPQVDMSAAPPLYSRLRIQPLPGYVVQAHTIATPARTHTHTQCTAAFCTFSTRGPHRAFQRGGGGGGGCGYSNPGMEPRTRPPAPRPPTRLRTMSGAGASEWRRRAGACE